MKMHFASLANEADRLALDGGSISPVAPHVAIDAMSNAYRQTASGSAYDFGAGASADPGHVSDPSAAGGAPSRASPSSGSLPGQYSSNPGATRQIRESDGWVEITETSRVLFVPFTSMTCQGEEGRERVVAECLTLDGQAGELVLTPSAADGLDGVFTAYASGMQIPLHLDRK